MVHTVHDIIPPVGLGTFRLKHDAVKPVMRDAIRLGYRHVDTATIYRNEAEIGEVLQEIYSSDANSLSREDFWITSKLSPYDMATPRNALLQTLSKLQTSYLDLYLIHWPAMARKPASSPENKRLRLEAWKVMNEARKEGLVRHVGVSNFTVEHLKELMETEWGIQDAFVQMEVHPWYWRDAAEIQKIFADHHLTIAGYALLAEGKLMAKDCPELIVQIANRTGLTKVQVVLSWARKKNWVVLIKSENENHLRQNLEIPSIMGALTADDVLAIDSISSNQEQKQCWDPRLVK